MPPPSPSPAQIVDDFQKGVELQQAGRLVEARTIFARILQTQPDHFGALQMAGVVDFQTGDIASAVNFTAAALRINPGHAAAHNNLGVFLAASGRHAQAIESYTRALTLKPDNAEAYNSRGVALQALGRHEPALADYDRAIAAKPGDVSFHNNRGNALKSLGRLEDALRSYDKAVALRPDLAEAHFNRGNALEALKRHEDAVASYDAALGLRPGYTQAFINRGNSLRRLKNFSAALESYDRAHATDPDNLVTLYNRAAVLGDMGRHAAALADYDAILARDPANADALNGRGLTLRELRRHAEAEESHHQAIALVPDHADAHWALAHAYLQRGNFSEGFKEFEWRWRNPALKLEPRHFAQPLWLGDVPLAGRTILIHSEQGFGDALQFMRYGVLVAALGARVVLEVLAPLEALAKTLPGVAEVVVKGARLPPFDYHCPLMSLPHAFKTEVHTIPHAGGYLRAPDDRRAAWRAHLGPKTGPRIGIAWSGNPAQKHNARRSIPLAEFSAALPMGLDYIVLQKDIAPEDRGALAARPDLLHFDEKMSDFADTAALCEATDLVVTVCTSTAHLAGALGRRSWILLAYNPDWRWLLDRSDSPWYDAATLYRQDTPGDWSSVLDRVRADLGNVFAATH